MDTFVQNVFTVRDDLFAAVTGCKVPEVGMTFDAPILQVQEGKAGYLSYLVMTTIKVTSVSEPYSIGYGTEKMYYLDVTFEVVHTLDKMQTVFVIDYPEVEDYFEDVEGIADMEVGSHQLLVVGAPKATHQVAYLTEKECQVSDYGSIYIY